MCSQSLMMFGYMIVIGTATGCQLGTLFTLMKFNIQLRISSLPYVQHHICERMALTSHNNMSNLNEYFDSVSTLIQSSRAMRNTCIFIHSNHSFIEWRTNFHVKIGADINKLSIFMGEFNMCLPTQRSLCMRV